MGNGNARGWNSSFMRGFGRTKLLYAYILEGNLILVFNEKVSIAGITGITLTSDAAALIVVAIVSGSGTSTVSLSLSRAMDESEIITLDIAEINDIYKFKGVSGFYVSTSLVIEALNDTTVFNNLTSFR